MEMPEGWKRLERDLSPCFFLYGVNIGDVDQSLELIKEMAEALELIVDFYRDGNITKGSYEDVARSIIGGNEVLKKFKEWK